MATLVTFSIDLKKIDKSKLVEGKKGTYLNCTAWINDQEDQFGNTVSVQQSLTKEEREAGASKIYLGNGKKFDQNGGGAQSSSPADDNGFPF